MASRTPFTLIGRLGKDPETRLTRERNYTVVYENTVAEVAEEYDVHIPSREYIVLSLCVETSPDEQTWYNDMKVWNSDRIEHRNIRFSQVGDLVEVTGYRETVTLKNPDRTFETLVVERLKWLSRPRKHWAPEIP